MISTTTHWLYDKLDPKTKWIPKTELGFTTEGAPLGPSQAFGGPCAIITMELHKPHLAF